MTYEWQWFDHATGMVRVVVEQGEPCVCEGEDLPHTPRLCEAIRAGNPAEWLKNEAIQRENCARSIDQP